ncbi:MAG TPA: hypothetical protein VJS37_10675 [Terriglobales bacterium]|nr:hypothetical protein [Terriglobales bacterium]
MDRFWQIVSYLEDQWLLGLAVVVWMSAVIGVALGTYDHWSAVWKMHSHPKNEETAEQSRNTLKGNLRPPLWRLQSSVPRNCPR